MSDIDFAILEDKSETAPWERLDGLVGAALRDPSVLADLELRLKELEPEDSYDFNNFEPVYLPYVLLEAARQDEAARQRLVEALVQFLIERSQADDDSAMEYVRHAIQTLHVDDYAPVLLDSLRHRVDPIESLECMVLWDMLEFAPEDGIAEIKEEISTFAMAILSKAEQLKQTGPGLQFVCYRLAELECVAALPLMERAEKRIRDKAERAIDRIDANGVRDAMELLQKKREPYKSKERWSLRKLVEEERAAYAKWYQTRDEEVEKFEDPEESREDSADVEEEREPAAPRVVYSEETLRKLEFTERQQPFRSEGKVGRNDPCPCGSGKKYKKCCGK